MVASEATERDPSGTVDDDEVARFSALAEEWWNPTGKFRPLHKFNPVRLRYVRDRLAGHFDRDPLSPTPLRGLRLLDIGCGGGLLSEPMARLGANVVGVDPSSRNIGVARIHAERAGLDIDYRAATAEALEAAGERFDVVLNMEVVEHVADVDRFLGTCANLIGPGGCMVAATLNRTPKSFALAIVGAEYVLRWLPRGTHDWRKFVRPSEIVGALRRHGVEVEELVGVTYNPLSDLWSTTRDLDVNYMLFAVKAEAGEDPA
jgi:2-polyprenyl-6-hydroxyphenyl methylase/3-demethylubiquinone-9 3-methyltransferase